MELEVTRREEFSTGHTLTQHQGKCRHLHGHNYVLETTVRGSPDEQGMVIDFGDLKDAIKSVVDRDLDHKFLIHQGDPRAEALKELDPDGVILTEFQPTAENLAIYIKLRVSQALPEQPERAVRVSRIKLWETGSCYAEV